MEIDFRHHTKLYLGLYEVELNRFIRELCPRGSDCFDVGGQSGYDALIFAKLSGSRVLSFECDPTAVATMHRVFAANPTVHALLEVAEATVAARSHPLAGRLALDDAAYGPHGFVPDLVKIDIDGGEAQALQGAQRLLRDRHPHLIVETHSPELELACAELLQAAGYVPTVVDQRTWLKDLRPIPHNRWLVSRGRDKIR
jgi:hypothetical protein